MLLRRAPNTASHVHLQRLPVPVVSWLCTGQVSRPSVPALWNEKLHMPTSASSPSAATIAATDATRAVRGPKRHDVRRRQPLRRPELSSTLPCQRVDECELHQQPGRLLPDVPRDQRLCLLDVHLERLSVQAKRNKRLLLAERSRGVVRPSTTHHRLDVRLDAPVPLTDRCSTAAAAGPGPVHHLQLPRHCRASVCLSAHPILRLAILRPGPAPRQRGAHVPLQPEQADRRAALYRTGAPAQQPL